MSRFILGKTLRALITLLIAVSLVRNPVRMIVCV